MIPSRALTVARGTDGAANWLPLAMAAPSNQTAGASKFSPANLAGGRVCPFEPACTLGES